jgi:hypothetical protein
MNPSLFWSTLASSPFSQLFSMQLHKGKGKFVFMIKLVSEVVGLETAVAGCIISLQKWNSNGKWKPS